MYRKCGRTLSDGDVLFIALNEDLRDRLNAVHFIDHTFVEQDE